MTLNVSRGNTTLWKTELEKSLLRDYIERWSEEKSHLLFNSGKPFGIKVPVVLLLKHLRLSV